MNSYLENNPNIEQKLYETLNKGTIMEPRNYVKTKKNPTRYWVSSLKIRMKIYV